MKKATVSGIGFKKMSIIDSAQNMIFTFNEEGEVVYELKTAGAGFDLWHLPNGNFLYSHLYGIGHGISVVTPGNEVVTRYLSKSEVFCCQPLSDGYVLVGELTEERIAIVSPSGKLEEVIPVKTGVHGHEVMRVARQLSNGDYLVVQPGDKMIRRLGSKGEVLAEYNTRADTFAVVEKKNGNLLYTAQTAVAEIDSDGREVWSMTAEEDFKDMGIHWFTGMQLLPDDNIVLCNWLGHGRQGTGVPIIAVSPEKKILWSLSAPDFTKEPANIQIEGVFDGK
ncbi:MAG: hypothetical protein E7672_06980 [Ruminococcaceae bacterium]|nr:hypothetical protein [Oscillospiraceae bacterium]